MSGKEQAQAPAASSAELSSKRCKAAAVAQAPAPEKDIDGVEIYEDRGGQLIVRTIVMIPHNVGSFSCCLF